jgi:hypothetical protein
VWVTFIFHLNTNTNRNFRALARWPSRLPSSFLLSPFSHVHSPRPSTLCPSDRLCPLQAVVR